MRQKTYIDKLVPEGMYMTIQEVADFLGYTKQGARILMHRHGLTRKFPGMRRLYVLRKAFEEWVQALPETSFDVDDASKI